MHMTYATRLLLVILTVSSLAAISGAYTTQVHASAVLEGADQGLLTLISLNVTPGNGSVGFGGSTNVNATTLDSARAAVQYASTYLSVNSMRYNFTFDIVNATGDVSGPSGGLAFTLLAISGLERKPVAQDFSVTGTIQPDGSVGLIGGIYDKIDAAKKGGMSYMIVPAAPASSMEALLYYISQQSFGITVAEVSNVSQAIPYAFGHATPTPTSVNFTQGFNVSGVSAANLTCASCNASEFGMLVNSTLNFTGGYIGNLSGNFGTAREQLLGNIYAYRALQGKGYPYTAADFAFLDFPKAFTLYNAGRFNRTDAAMVEANVSSYCSSLSAPPLTDTNYGYVIGGNIRRYWANITLNASQEMLNSTQTTDDVVQSIYGDADALAWCKAADIQYQIASSLGGNYVSVPPSMKAYVGSLASGLGSEDNIYSQSEAQAYDSGDYATALYAIEYEKAFGRPLPNLNDSQMAAAASENMMNSTSGTWPYEFALQAEFFLNEAEISQNATLKAGYLDQAYSTSALASGLAAADAKLSGSFTSAGAVPSGAILQKLSGLQQEVAALQQELSEVYVVLLVVMVLLFALLVAILVLALRPRAAAGAPAQGRGRGRPRAR